MHPDWRSDCELTIDPYRRGLLFQPRDFKTTGGADGLTEPSSFNRSSTTAGPGSITVHPL
jgi:hypothetical protein